MLRRFFRDSRGASGAEYALILAIVGLGIGAAALALGGNVAAAVGSDAQQMYDLNTAP